MDNEKLLDLNDEKTKEYAGAIFFSICVIVFGIVGNAFGIAFFGFKAPKTSTNNIVAGLSIIDFATCFAFTGEVVELFYSVTYTFVGVCKTLYFLNHWLVVSSGLTLFLVAFDRYRKICAAFKWQFSIFAARLTLLGLVLLSFAISLRDFFIIDVERVNVTNTYGDVVEGYYCAQTTDPNLAIVPTIFHLIDLILFMTSIVGSSVLYAIIAGSVWKHKKKIKRHTTGRPSEDNSSTTTQTKSGEIKLVPGEKIEKSGHEVTSTSNDVKVVIDRNSTPSYYDCPTELQPETLARYSSRKSLAMSLSSKTKLRINAMAAFKIEIKITLMMAIIFIVSMACFIPHFVVNLLTRSGMGEKEHTLGTQIAIRLFMINSAINPYIMWGFNGPFRKYTMKVLRCKSPCCN